MDEKTLLDSLVYACISRLSLEEIDGIIELFDLEVKYEVCSCDNRTFLALEYDDRLRKITEKDVMKGE